MGRLGSRLVAIVVVCISVFWWRSSRTEDASVEVLAEARELVSGVEGYAVNAAYIDDLVGRAHQLAFPGAYDPGSPRRRWSSAQPESFKEDKYLKALFMHMNLLARRDRDSFNAEQARQMKDFVAALDKLRESLGIEKPPGA